MLTATSVLFDSRVQKEARSLREAGYEVVILSIEDQGLVASLTDESAIVKALEENLPGVELKRYLLHSRMWRFLPGSVNKALQAIEFALKLGVGVVRTRADIYHCHDLTPAVFCWLGKWIYKARLVYDAHELEIDMGGAQGMKRSILKYYERAMINRSNLNLTVNDAIKDMMERSYARPVHVVQNRPYHYPPEQLDREVLRKELNIHPKDSIVMYVGYLTMERGLDKLILALKYALKPVHVVIMGTGRIQEFRSQMDRLMDANDIDKALVHFVNPVPPSEVIRYLCGADVSAMLYQQTSDNMIYNAPNKLYQSIIAQVPILSSRNATFPPIVEPSEALRLGKCIDAADPQEIASGIMYLLRPEVQLLCRSNLQVQSANVSWEREEAKFIKLYQTFVSETA